MHRYDTVNRLIFTFSFLDSLVSVLQPGKSFVGALTDFEKFVSDLSGKFRAVAFISVQNMADIDLHTGKFLVGLGVTGDILPNMIPSGTKQAFAIKQNDAFKGVEIAATWKISDKLLVAILVNTYQTAAWRPPNKLGVCQQSSTGAPTSYSGWKDSKCLTSHDFKTDVHTMQCCGDDYCIQGTMSTDNHSNTTIRILPKKVKQLASKHYHESKYQKMLSELLDNPKSCYVNSAVQAGVRAVQLFGIALLYIVYSWLWFL